MQNRYVGDVGDFSKYALLRLLAGLIDAQPQIRLGVAWWLFPDEGHNGDGRHVSYLDRGQFWNLDPILHHSLQKIVRGDARSVAAISEAGIFANDTVFFDELISPANNQAARPTIADRAQRRSEWLARCLDATAECNLVFLDPDNGIETKSVGLAHPKAGKYVFWNEIEEFVRRGQSLVVYHHLNRTMSAYKQIQVLRQAFRERFPHLTGVTPVLARRGSCRVFWIVPTQLYQDLLIARLETFRDPRWSTLFEIPPNALAAR